MLFPDQAGSGLVIIQTCGLESSRCVRGFTIWFLLFVSLSSLDQTDLVNNVTGNHAEVMAGGRAQGLLRHAIHLNRAPHVRALLIPSSSSAHLAALGPSATPPSS